MNSMMKCFVHNIFARIINGNARMDNVFLKIISVMVILTAKMDLMKI